MKPAADELAQIEAAAAALESGPAQLEAPAPAEPAGPDLAGEITMGVNLALQVLGPALPSLRPIYTPETIRAAAESIAALCRKHGWLQDGLFARWGEEIVCAAICLPLAWQTNAAVRRDIAALKQRQAVPVEPQGQAPNDRAAAAPPAPAAGDGGP